VRPGRHHAVKNPSRNRVRPLIASRRHNEALRMKHDGFAVAHGPDLGTGKSAPDYGLAKDLDPGSHGALDQSAPVGVLPIRLQRLVRPRVGLLEILATQPGPLVDECHARASPPRRRRRRPSSWAPPDHPDPRPTGPRPPLA